MTAIALTREQLAALKPCSDRSHLFGRRKKMNARQALEAGASIADLLWVADRLGRKDLCVRFALGCAQRVAHLNPDPRVQEALDATQAWLDSPTPEVASERAAAGAAAGASVDAAWAAEDAAEDAGHLSGDFRMPRPFNDGIRVLWSSGGDPVFRDHEGRKQFIGLHKLRDVRKAIYTLAIKATGRERDALCIIWAEADVAYTDALKWRQASRGIFLVKEDAS